MATGTLNSTDFKGSFIVAEKDSTFGASPTQTRHLKELNAKINSQSPSDVAGFAAGIELSITCIQRRVARR
jgi:hypothetical protein